MRKFLLVILIIILCVAGYFIMYHDISFWEGDYTYADIKEEFEKYKQAVTNLNQKNSELEQAENQLNPEKSDVIKTYNKNKSEYEYIVEKQKQMLEMDGADIYNLEYIWQKIGDIAKDSDIGVEVTMDVTKSDTDLDSDDYVMCNLDFTVVGYYTGILSYMHALETDASLQFHYYNFFLEQKDGSARNQNQTENADTENLPEYTTDTTNEENSEDTTEDDEYTEETETEEEKENKNKLKATFSVYNIPVNKTTVTGIKEKTTTTVQYDENGNIIETDENAEATDETSGT